MAQAWSYTSPLPCTSLNESNSILNPNFDFCEGNNHNHLKEHIDLQSQAIYVDKKNPRKTYILEDGASRYTEHIIV